VNNLNSILIEGCVVGVMSDDTFLLRSKRVCEGTQGKLETRYTHVQVKITNPQLLKRCKTHCKDGRGVRAVGRLTEYRSICPGCLDMYINLMVFAEHVEFRPEVKNSTKKK
jgi:hypothetical protein